jgi:integrase
MRACRRFKLAKLPEVDFVHDLRVPDAVQRLIGPDPRDIRLRVWAKLVHASLNLTDDAIRAALPRYPAAMIRTHAGLRSAELPRLRVGCARALEPGIDQHLLDGADPEVLELADHICVLDVPASKMSPPYSKPVGRIVAEAVAAWEKIRPTQPMALDAKINQQAHFLLSVRGRRVHKSFMNKHLIPFLCAQAGVPLEDVPGKKITCHRGRASLATWLFNTTEGMMLEELRQWLGHRSPATTANYTRTRRRKLMAKFAKADDSARLIEVLVDMDAVARGDTSRAAVLFPLGNDDFCSNPFFTTCPHKLACIGCGFHKKSDSQEAALVRASQGYQRMLQELQLDDEERAVLEECRGVVEKAAREIAARRKNVPAPDGTLPGRALPVLS